MTAPWDMAGGLDDNCGCGEGSRTVPSVRTAVANPPGAPALAYRSGTHGTVLRRMLAALATELPALTVRGTDDPAAALLDAWATVADVVTFYQERIANEGFLRTATERRSVLELARAIGYELHPGVAASTHLAFTVESAPGVPPTAPVPAGTRVRSVPGRDELPQTFETSTDLLAVAGRNAPTLRLGRPQRLVRGIRQLYLAGDGTGLRPGDALLVVGDERRESPDSEQWDFRVLRTVEVRPARAPGDAPVTRVGWDVALGFDHDVPARPAERGVTVYAFRLRAALFGHQAPDWRTMPDTIRARYAGKDHDGVTEWPGFSLPGPDAPPVIDLDGDQPGIGPGSWLVLNLPGHTELYRAKSAEPSAGQGFGITGRTTRILLDTGEHLSGFGLRATAVYAGSEQLTLSDEPLGGTVQGPELALPDPLLATGPPWPTGSPVVVTGRTAEEEPVTEVAFVDSVTARDGGTALVLTAPLSRPLLRDSVTVLGNVVAATHGETVADEVLGSGDGAVPFQRFTLRHAPLTHVPARTPSGVRDTLVVRVDGVARTPSGSLFPLGPHDPAYVVRTDDDTRATVVSGDGRRGARLPTGQENVRATYRFGIGPQGNVPAHALSLLPQRPLGIREVANPLPAAGGTAPEVLADARAHAPLTVLTLDRIVSLRDHEDFARAFGGIAVARATALWGGTDFFVHVSVVAPGGGAVDEVTLGNLRAVVDGVRDRTRAVVVADCLRPTFRVGVAVLAEPAYRKDDVHTAVTGALRQAYAFERRAFAQPVTASEVITAVQGVPGVIACRLTALHLSTDAEAVHEVLVAHDAHRGPGGVVVPAALLLLDRVAVTEMAP
ncbi:putative baseplate assembly protein [Streptomyces sp. NPDC021093]|uniref:putative baseplate assembly protein n=1 Tax=Streptomyces sp. NPDC021093 TaxID=3365112 RepID=UPI003799CC15